MNRFLFFSVAVLIIGLQTAQAQDIYVSVEIDVDPNQCSILLIESDGTLSEAASNAAIQAATGESACDLDDTGLAVAADGTVYFTEDESHDVLQIAPDGTVSVLVESATLDALIGETADADNGLAIGPDGNIYVADEDCNCVIQITPAGAASIFVTETEIETATGKPEVNLEGGLTFGSDGTMYFAEDGSNDLRNSNDDDLDLGEFTRGDPPTDNDRILALSPGGILSVLTTEAQIIGILPSGADNTNLDVDIEFLNGTLYVLNDGEDAALIAIDPDTGTPSLVADNQTFETSLGLNIQDGGFDPEGGIGVDPTTGTLLVGTDPDDEDADANLPIIARVTPAGAVSVAVSDAQILAFYQAIYGPDNDYRLRGGLDVRSLPLPETQDVPTLSPFSLTLLVLMMIGLVAVTKLRN